ncbi:MAG: hypothetical protein ACFFBJ_04305 [Promethearchaeota archaeon]
MDSLGTITVYFPFLDKETKNVLETIMEETPNYAEFVKELTQRVLTTEATDLVVYFAVHHAAQLLDLITIEKIGQKYPDVSIIQPNVRFASHFQGKTDDFSIVIQAAETVLKTNPESWLALEMRFMKYEAETFNYPSVIQDSANVDAIYKLIKSESNFDFYNTVLYNNLARIADIDGNSDEYARCNQIAIDTARKNDDQVRLAYCLIEKAEINAEDRILARELLQEALRITDDLSATEAYALVLQQISHLEMIRGEFTIAIEHCLEVVKIQESLGMETGLIALRLSTLYNIVGQSESGLEWATMAEYQFKNRPFYKPRAVMRQIWSLVVLDRLAEAELLLNSVHDEILKSGREKNLAWLNFVIGLIHYANNDFVSATSNIEEALKIFENIEGTMMTQNIFLRFLAMIEVTQSDKATEVLPYLTLLEERATSDDLPGILGQVLLLRADLAMKQSDDASLREAIKQLTLITQEPKTAFLMPFLESLLQRI